MPVFMHLWIWIMMLRLANLGFHSVLFRVMYMRAHLLMVCFCMLRLLHRLMLGYRLRLLHFWL